MGTKTGTKLAGALGNAGGAISGLFGKGNEEEENDTLHGMFSDTSSMRGNQFEVGDYCMVSKMLGPADNIQAFFAQDSQDTSEGPQQTFFAPQSKLNDSAMIEYGLKKANQMERKMSVDRKSRQGSSDPSDFDEMVDNDEFWERFDSRGKKMKLRRCKVLHPPLRNI